MISAACTPGATGRNSTPRGLVSPARDIAIGDVRLAPRALRPDYHKATNRARIDLRLGAAHCRTWRDLTAMSRSWREPLPRLGNCCRSMPGKVIETASMIYRCVDVPIP